MQASPVAQWAMANGIDTHKPESKDEIGKLVNGLDLVLTIGFGTIIPEDILQIPRYGFINLHFSLLPRWRGAAPVQRAIEAGDSVTGVTVFQLDKGMDTGPIYSTSQITLSSEVSTGQLFDTLADLGVKPVLSSLQMIVAGEKPKPQSEVGATRAKKLSKEEGRIDWTSEALDILRKVNAFNPNPGAWSEFRGQVLKINAVRISDQILPAGQINSFSKSILVGTSSYAVELIEVTPAGKSTLSASAWANGARLTSSDSLI
jgi:methionyl-tRNA formyltransferase